MKTVLDIGNCNADHGFLKAMLQMNCDANLVRAHKLDDALAALAENEIDLIMINRLLDVDRSEGMDVFRRLKDSEFSDIPVMLITNFEDHQKAAVAEGTVEGFGKNSLNNPETIEKVKNALRGV